VPPLPVIDNVYRVAFNWTNGSAHAVNVMHFLDTTHTVTELVGLLGSDVQTDQFDVLHEDWSAPTCSVTPLDGSSSTTEHALANWSGVQSGDYVPQVAAIVKYTTLKRGRSYRGRTFLPGVAEAASGNGKLNGSSFTLMSTAWPAYHTALAGHGVNLVIASYKHSTADLVTSVLVELETGTQRRRMERLRK
jgi:hypothetical protein